MAKRRRRRRSGGLGAVAKHGSSGPGYGLRRFHVFVNVHRDIGASTKHQYIGDACVARKKAGRASLLRSKGGFETRCGGGRGRTPTAAGKAALRDLAKHLK